MTLVPVHLRADLAALLEHPDRIGDVPAAEVPALVLRLAALQSAAAARLHRLATEAQVDDCECLDVEEVSRRLKCSVDLVRQRGEQWRGRSSGRRRRSTRASRRSTTQQKRSATCSYRLEPGTRSAVVG